MAEAVGLQLEGRPVTLTRRASLNALQSLLDYAAKMAVGLVVTPFLVHGLGRALYGVWEILNQLASYISPADGRPSSALRLVVANQQADPNVAAKRRAVGAALVVWLCFFPLIVVIAAGLVWLAPTIAKVTPDERGTVRIAAALLGGSFLLQTLGAVPEAVLRGMNLGFKRMGLQASLDIVAGLLMAAAVALGFGLAGLGLAQILTALATGACFWVLVRRYVPWFRAARPTRPEVRALAGMSVWIALGEVVAKLLLASDVVILGAVLTPAIVTTYVLTRYASRTALGILQFTVSAAMPGLAGVIGQRDFDRAAQLRRELLTLTWVFAAAVGSTILVWNRSFLSLWVGGNLYAGLWPNLLIVLLAAQTAIIRTDAYFIDASLLPRQRVIYGAVATAVSIAAALLLTPLWGIAGLCLALLLGRSTQAVAYPLVVARALERPRRLPWTAVARPAAAMGLLFAAAAVLGDRLLVRHWVAWAPLVVLTFAATGALALGGLERDDRRKVLQRCRDLARGIRG